MPLGQGPLYKTEAAFKTPSGKVEIVSERWESQGVPSLKPFESTHPPEAVFVLHGFGHRLPLESRAFGRGVADHELMCGGLDRWPKSVQGTAD